MRQLLTSVFLAVAATVAVTTSAGAQSIGPGDSIPDSVRTALANLKESGRLTVEEKELIRSYPEIARIVPDPDAPAEVVGYAVPAEGSDAANLVPKKDASGELKTMESDGGSYGAPGCMITNQGVRKVSLTGSTQFRYMTRIDYCTNGSIVTSVHQKYHYLSEPDTVTILRGYTGNTPAVSGTGGWRSDVAIHAWIELCTFKIACYASLYPRVDMVIRGSGYVTWTAVV